MQASVLSGASVDGVSGGSHARGNCTIALRLTRGYRKSGDDREWRRELASSLPRASRHQRLIQTSKMTPLSAVWLCPWRALRTCPDSVRVHSAPTYCQLLRWWLLPRHRRSPKKTALGWHPYASRQSDVDQLRQCWTSSWYYLKDLRQPDLSYSHFRQSLKTSLYGQRSVKSALTAPWKSSYLLTLCSLSPVEFPFTENNVTR